MSLTTIPTPESLRPTPGAVRAAETTTAKCVANPPYYYRDKEERDPEVLRNAEIIDRETGVRELEGLVKELLFAAENADETGYVTDVGFIDLDDLYDRARAAIARCEGKVL